MTNHLAKVCGLGIFVKLSKMIGQYSQALLSRTIYFSPLISISNSFKNVQQQSFLSKCFHSFFQWYGFVSVVSDFFDFHIDLHLLSVSICLSLTNDILSNKKLVARVGLEPTRCYHREILHTTFSYLNHSVCLNVVVWTMPSPYSYELRWLIIVSARLVIRFRSAFSLISL